MVPDAVEALACTAAWVHCGIEYRGSGDGPVFIGLDGVVFLVKKMMKDWKEL